MKGVISRHYLAGPLIWNPIHGSMHELHLAFEGLLIERLLVYETGPGQGTQFASRN